MTNSAEAADNATLTRELLTDSFGRVREEVEGVLAGADEAMLAYRPDADANSIGWLVWHLTRIQDDHVHGLAGTEQVWIEAGWVDRFDLGLDVRDTGYGHNASEVAAVVATPQLLDGYQADVHRSTLAYIDSLAEADLSRVVDRRWDPPVTASARLVSVLGDCQQHLGQAGYVRGLFERLG